LTMTLGELNMTIKLCTLLHTFMFPAFD
jgi:hypothetical protein